MFHVPFFPPCFPAWTILEFFPVPYIVLPCLRWLVISKANNATRKLFVLLAVVVGCTCWESMKMHEHHDDIFNLAVKNGNLISAHVTRSAVSSLFISLLSFFDPAGWLVDLVVEITTENGLLVIKLVRLQDLPCSFSSLSHQAVRLLGIRPQGSDEFEIK